MAEYTVVTIDEIREVLKAEKGWKEVTVAGCRERVFDFPLDVRRPGAVIRVYSGVEIGQVQCRPCGSDAIRVIVVKLRDSLRGGVWQDRPLIKAARVHRVKGWRANLQKRVLSVLEKFPKPAARPAAHLDRPIDYNARVDRSHAAGQGYHAAAAYLGHSGVWHA